MSKIAQYLQEHLLGEVTASESVRRRLAHDGSVLALAPKVAVYPRNENDVRKTVRFSWQLAQKGRVLPITARGGGSDTSGAAIGSGIVLIFTAHMDRILSLDPRKRIYTAEPGINYDELEQTLFTHGLFLPPYPASSPYATLGGGLANNAVGEKSLKYGDMRRWVKSLRVVLANGEVIETGPLDRRALNNKMGLSTFEGQVYRSVDALLEDKAESITKYGTISRAAHNSVGYNLAGVQTKAGFDLTPLFVGSQGTLGIITEATLSAAVYNPVTALAHVSLNTMSDFAQVLSKILALKPSAFEMLNRAAINQVGRLNPRQLHTLQRPKAAIHLFIEFDEQKPADRKKAIKSLQAIVASVDGFGAIAETYDDQLDIWKLRDSVSTLFLEPDNQHIAVPVAEDICVPVDSLVEFLNRADEILMGSQTAPAMWGQAGSGIVRLHPQLDLSNVGDRQKVFTLADSLYKTATGLGGSLSASAGEGRIRAPYARELYGPEFYELVKKTKQIFDPHGILNPGVKTTSLDDLKAMLRTEYSSIHRHEHLPRS